MIYDLLSYKYYSRGYGIDFRKCFIVYYEPNYYVISVGHNIETCNLNYIKFDNNEIYLNEKRIIIPELDLIIFYFNNEEKLDFFNIKNNKFNIVYDAYYYNENEIININNLEIDKCSYNNPCLPDMLMYKGILDNYIDTKGLSGSPIFNNENIIGIQCGQTNNTREIIIIPFFFVFRILDEIKIYNEFYGLCFFNIDLEENIISNNIEIDYNQFSRLNNCKVNNLQKGDYIKSLDNIKIRENKIFCSLLNIDLDINDYITINKTIQDKNNFEIIRDSNKNKKEINILSGNIDIKSCYSLDFNNFSLEDKLVEGMVCKEVNPELFRYLISIGLKSKIDYKYFINKPSNFRKKNYYSIKNDLYK